MTSQSEDVRAALGELDREIDGEIDGEIDIAAVTAAWQTVLRAPDWSLRPTWLHGDLLPGNLLVRDGGLRGVLDFALVGVGDPACDLIAAWSVLPAAAREAFRVELDVDDATWSRGRGWALSIGLVALPYYKDTNPGFTDVARHLIREVLAEA